MRKMKRGRAFSECIKISSMTLYRPQSDSDLSHIDRIKTFAFDSKNSAMELEPGELISKVAVALGGLRMNSIDDTNTNMDSAQLGIHGFSDSEILASEHNFSDWSIETSGNQKPYQQKNSNIPLYGRNRRALSEVRIPIEDTIKVTNLTLHFMFDIIIGDGIPFYLFPTRFNYFHFPFLFEFHLFNFK